MIDEGEVHQVAVVAGEAHLEGEVGAVLGLFHLASLGVELAEPEGVELNFEGSLVFESNSPNRLHGNQLLDRAVWVVVVFQVDLHHGAVGKSRCVGVTLADEAFDGEVGLVNGRGAPQLVVAVAEAVAEGKLHMLAVGVAVGAPLHVVIREVGQVVGAAVEGDVQSAEVVAAAVE